MANLGTFNAHEVDPNVSFDPVPEGKYLAAITESEMKPTKNGQGSYLQLTLTLIDGNFRGRMLWARLNLTNPNATAVKMALSELSAICHAVGVMQPRDSVELHNIPLLITVKVKKRSDNNELTNEIKGYEPSPGRTPTSAPQSSPTAAPVDAGSTVNPNTPPWRR